MRVANPSTAPAVSQSAESKPVTTAVKPAAATESKAATTTAAAKPAPGFPRNDEFNLTRPHPLPGPRPLPFPLPPIFRPDTQTRATQASQLNQIADGVRNGSITAQEAEKLLAEQAKIAGYQRQAMADGFLSQEERLRLSVMQTTAALNTFVASHNGDRNAFARFDGTAQQQAAQIDQIAQGRRNGNITNSEAGHLLRDQVEIADARGDADSPREHLELRNLLSEASRDIKYHSQPGTQFQWKPFPLPGPVMPKPRPLPFPEPRPLPSLPRPELPSKPDFHILPYKGVINA